MARNVGPASIAIMKMVNTHTSLSIAEVRAILADPSINAKSKVNELQQNGFLRPEIVKGAGRQYHLTNKGREAIGLEPLAAETDEPAMREGVAAPRHVHFMNLPVWQPEPWALVRAGSMAFLSVPSRGIGV